MTADAAPDDDHVDDHVDVEIASCLDPNAPKSFFLFAGAGSGKTRSLVNGLDYIRQNFRPEMRVRGQRVAVVTYTNAASEEIARRLDFDAIFVVSTIHSFAWTLIDGLNRDIREWLRVKLAQDILEVEGLEARGRKGTKASNDRLAQIESKKRRIQSLNSIKRFIYSPTGENRSRDSLNHAEVIAICADFISTKPTMQHLIVGAYPIILVDESQDTSKLLVDALFKLQANNPKTVGVGLLGDMMQRIYADGKEGLGEDLPADWATPAKKMNHRSTKRVVRLINKIRETVDHQQQNARSTAAEGTVRMFILSAETADKPAAERSIAYTMAELTGDEGWSDPKACKRLILEHRMAARRMGFLDLFVPLQQVEEFRTGLLDGSLPITRFFAEDVLPLLSSQDQKFATARALRAKSPLLDIAELREAPDPAANLKRARDALAALLALWDDNSKPTFRVVLESIARSHLLYIPDVLRNHLRRTIDAQDASGEQNPEGEDAGEDMADRFAERTAAIEAFLDVPFEQIAPYAGYVSGTAPFDTHQGVKGLEFPRVMVIMDDIEARGFMFKYEKLFGGADQDDKTAASTRRLFYVTCSRAEETLALVAYSTEPERVRRHVIAAGWFEDAEVIMVPAAA